MKRYVTTISNFNEYCNEQSLTPSIDKTTFKKSTIEEKITKSKKIKVKKTEEKQSTSTIDDIDVIDELDSIDNEDIQFDREYLADQIESSMYGQPPVDYMKIFYDGEKKLNNKEEDKFYTPTVNKVDESMTAEEAKEVIIETNHAVVMGTVQVMNLEKKRKYQMWKALNPSQELYLSSSYSQSN